MGLPEKRQNNTAGDQMNRIVITGAGGFIGRALVASLAHRPDTFVIAADNNFRGSLDTLDERGNITKVHCDVCNVEAVNEVCRKADMVLHLAAINGTKNFYEMPASVLEVGIIGTHNVLKASIEHHVKRVVFVSSSEVYNVPDIIPTPETVECRVPDVFNPRFSYGGSKIAGELMTVHYLLTTPTDFVILRPHNVYGAQMGFEHVIPQIVKKVFDGSYKKTLGEETITIEIEGTGEETRAFIFIDDAVRAIELCALDSLGKEVYNIGTEKEITIKEVIVEIGRALGKKVLTRSSRIRVGSTPRRCPDTSKIRALGFVPKISLQEGMRRSALWYWEYFQSQHSTEKNEPRLLSDMGMKKPDIIES